MRKHPRRMRGLVPSLAVMIAASALALPALAEAAKNPVNVSVMTRNVYLGSDLLGAIGATSQTELFEEAGEIYRNVQATNFNARARVLAKEVQTHKPDLIGLQEVALWRRGPSGAADGPATPAEEVVYDFLSLLRGELNELGLDYRVAEVTQEFDLELPLDFDNDDAPDAPAFDGRLTMRDVVLVRDKKRIKTRNPRGANFAAAAPADITPAGPGPEDVDILRGYNLVDVVKKAGGKRKKGQKARKVQFRFANTHLEAFSAFFRNVQAGELVNPNGGPLEDTSVPTILVGDLNSDPADPTSQSQPPLPDVPNRQAYVTITGAGFVDAGVDVNTCCHADDLLNPPPAAFTSRIDHILTRGGGFTVKGSKLVGADAGNRTPTGLWPSDHGGVVTRFKVK